MRGGRRVVPGWSSKCKGVEENRRAERVCTAVCQTPISRSSSFSDSTGETPQGLALDEVSFLAGDEAHSKFKFWRWIYALEFASTDEVIQWGITEFAQPLFIRLGMLSDAAT